MYTREELREYGVLELRKLGMMVGVKLPTTLNKAELIEEILLINSGAKAPHVKIKKGRRMAKQFGESFAVTANKNYHNNTIYGKLQKAVMLLSEVMEILDSD